MNIVKGENATIESMFKTMGGWTTQFEVNGNLVGGTVDVLTKDPRLIWHLQQVGGAVGKRVLELGPLEGAHTKMMIEAGVKEVIAVEGNPDCFLRCLIVKEAFQLTQAKFLFGDFNLYIRDYQGEKFDFISAAGVLYHQINPVRLIYDMAKITDTVIVWTQLAGSVNNVDMEGERFIQYNDVVYKGRNHNYYGARKSADNYCGGLDELSFWLYPDDMRKCFCDAGFINIVELPIAVNEYGYNLTFVASKP